MPGKAEIEISILSYSVEEAAKLYNAASFSEKAAMIFYHYAILATANKAELPEIIYCENHTRSGKFMDVDSYKKLVEASGAVLEDFIAACETEDSSKVRHHFYRS